MLVSLPGQGKPTDGILLCHSVIILYTYEKKNQRCHLLLSQFLGNFKLRSLFLKASQSKLASLGFNSSCQFILVFQCIRYNKNLYFVPLFYNLFSC